MIPESQYIEDTITVRNMKLPTEVTLTKGSLIRWLALSLGLINPNESRKTVVDLVEILFDNQLKTGSGLTVNEIMAKLRSRDKSISEKTVRYHLLKMEKKGILVRKNKEYSLKSSDFDVRDIEAMIKAYEEKFNDSMDKIKIAITKLKGMY